MDNQMNTKTLIYLCTFLDFHHECTLRKIHMHKHGQLQQAYIRQFY